METGLNIAIVIGVALSLLKGGELILRSHQRQAVQAFLEDFTLRLDAMSFKEIAQRMTSPDAQYCFVVLGFVEFSVGIALAAGSNIPVFFARGWVGLIELFSAVATITAVLAAAWRWPVPNLMSWIVGSADSRVPILVRFCGFIICGLGIVRGVQLGFEHLVADNVSSDVVTLTFKFLKDSALFALVMIFLIIFQAVVMMLLIRFFVVRILFICLRGLMWRIVEHDKGATAAIILLVTVMLATCKELLT